MFKFKTAFVTFFPIIPDNMGSSTVINSRFKNWPNKKKLFQISHLKDINNSNLKTIPIKSETPINRIVNLPKLIFEVFNLFSALALLENSAFNAPEFKRLAILLMKFGETLSENPLDKMFSRELPICIAVSFLKDTSPS